MSAEQADEQQEQMMEKTGVACDRIRKMTKQCIKESECVQVKRNRARDCLNDGDLPEKVIHFL
jgi:hypothetical protein